jgi:hypothetical protein
MKKLFGITSLWLAVGMFSPAAQACSVCFGDPTSSLSKGAIAGVSVLLVIVLGVLGGISAFFVHVSKKTAALAAEKEQELSVSSAERV